MLRLKLHFSFFFSYVTLLLPFLLQAQAPSVLTEGTWFQLAVANSGVYQVSGSFLQQQGVDISSIQTDHLGIFGYGGGMLPQSLTEDRFSDLPENRIELIGMDDGRFDPEDRIVFYAQGPDKIGYFKNEDDLYQLQFEKNLYADTAYYYLSLDRGNGLRINSQPSENLSATTVSSFDDYWVHEVDEYNILEPGSGREWYGENFYDGEQLILNPQLNGLEPAYGIKLTAKVLGRTTSASSMEVRLNQQSLGEIAIPSILGGTYTDKGKEATANFEINSTDLGNPDNLEITMRYRAADGRGQAHLNRVLLHFSRELRLYNDQTVFRSLASLSNQASRFIVATNNQEALVWEISNPQNPVSQQAEYVNGAWEFVQQTQGLLREFVVFDPATLPTPQWKGQLNGHTLNTSAVPDLVIITPHILKESAERLAAFRRSHDQMDATVATTEAIYRQYASGRQDVSAIRNYVKDLYDAEPGKLKYLLLFGKASYDYKDRVENNTNLVPTYQSRNSLHPIYSFPSDDYYAFLEDSEGYWEETFRGDHTLDIGVGRLPVKNIAEAEAVVDKLVHYAVNASSRGDWRTQVTFLADDGDNDRYQRDSEQLSANVNEKISGINTHKIYLDAFEQEQFPNQELAPKVNEAIEETIIQGSLLFNFVGHGNEQRLTDENVLNVGMISRWENLDRLPFFVTATCEFGRHDDPDRISGAERLVLNPQGGAVGTVTTARPVFSNTNYLLNQAFYQHVFSRQDGDFLRIGDIFRLTKNSALNGRDNRNFTLLGDPSMRLAYPEHSVVIDSIRSLDGQQSVDTLRAFQPLRFFGRISENGQSGRLDSFDGEVTLVLHDKAKILQTRGNEGTQMQFQQTDNVINRVRASVKNGMFSVDLLVPQNINYQTEQGRITLYALSEHSPATDAFGGLDSLYIGGSLSTLKDEQSPQIRLFINDTTFRSGGLTHDDPSLIAYFEDEQGINLSQQQIGHEITARLESSDNGELIGSWILNNFYEPALNSYQQGKVDYPIGNLDEGKYILTLQAWDTHNNRAEATTEFVVTSGEKLLIQNFNNFPNPFNQYTTFVLEHNREGDDLRLQLDIFDVLGNKIVRHEDEVFNASGRINFLEWKVQNQLSKKLSPGIYLARLTLESLSDQQVVVENLRIILTN